MLNKLHNKTFKYLLFPDTTETGECICVFIVILSEDWHYIALKTDCMVTDIFDAFKAKNIYFSYSSLLCEKFMYLIMNLIYELIKVKMSDILFLITR